MAKMTIRSTYSFDDETVQKLDRLADHWNTSKSEALRRSIDRVAEQTLRNCEDAIAALEELQRRMAEAGVDTEKWAKEVREERRASSEKRLSWLSE